MRTAAALFLLVLLTGTALAQEPRLDELEGQEFNARGLHVLVYHPYPDPQGDPWGFPDPSANGTGHMETAYGAYWYPTSLLDAVERIEGASSFLETYNAHRDAYLERRLEDSPLRLFVTGALGDDSASVTVRAQDKRDASPGPTHLRAVLYEDEVAFDGGNGVDTHRFVVREVLYAGPYNFNATGYADLTTQAALKPEWDRSRLGVVVSIHDASTPHRAGEVLQATTYRYDQEGPTIQDRRGVLLETLSATWCDACVYGDGAIDELANEFGIQSTASQNQGPAYVRPFAPTFAWPSTGTLETGVLVFALGAFIVAFGADLSRMPQNRRERLTHRAMAAGAIALVLALVLLLVYFLAGNLAIEYVFSYTRLDYPWYYRLAGLWAGQKGTLLLWAAATGFFALAFLRRGARAASSLPADAPTTLRVTRRVLLLVLVALTWATLVARTFAPTSTTSLSLRPLGNGLQPVLLTPFMVIHPPIQFLSYALTAIPFAAGLAHVATGGRSWARLTRPWVRLNWLLATIGLGLGGLWAYYVLNFGGFWAWDPVETANLLAWFPLTLLLHSFIGYEKGDHRTVAPLFALLTMPMVLFSTVATRTGLWVSVHAFTDPTENFARDPLVRLLNILETSELLRLLVALFLLGISAAFAAVAYGRVRHSTNRRRWQASITVAAGLGAALLLLDVVAALGATFQLAHAITLGRSAPFGLLLLGFAAVALVLVTGPEPAAAATERQGWRRWVEPGPLVTLGILLLGLAFLAVFLIDIGGINGYDRRVFDERAPYVALPILLVLAAHFLRGLYDARIALAFPMGAGLLGGVLAIAFRDHAPVLLVLPALLLVAAASLLRFVHTAAAKEPTRRLERATAILLMAGALAALIQWGNPPSRLFGMAVPWTLAIPAYALASGALLAGALHLGRPGQQTAFIGGLLLVPLVGPFGLTSLAGAAAILLATRSQASSAPRQALFERRAALRKSAVYLLHLGLALGLTGYAFATYESVATESFATGPGSRSVRGYTFEPLDATFTSRDLIQGLPLEVHADVRVFHQGRSIGDATLVYWLVQDGTPGHYDARVTVLRRATEDVYLFPAAIHLRGLTLTDHINGASPQDATLEGVDLAVKVLPGTGLVWSGLWILGLAMVGRLAFGGFTVGVPSPKPRQGEAAQRHGPAPAPGPVDANTKLL